MTKRLLSLACAIILAFGIIPAMNIQSDAAATGYNADASLKYAKKTWNNGVGLCAEYASRCLTAGGVDVFETRVINLYNTLSGTYGKSYKLNLTGGTRGKISMDDNKGKLKSGDPIFYKCNYCGDFEHVVICNGTNGDGYSQDFAHNKPHNGYKTTYTYRHCGGESWTLYSISMYETEKLFGSKSTVKAPKISSAVNGANGIILKWNTIDGADKYRVYRKTNGLSWKKLCDTKKTYFTDKKAVNGESYTYTVRAIDGKNASQYYGGEAIKCLGLPKLGKLKVSEECIKINWQTVDSADGYYVYRKLPGESWKRIGTAKGRIKKSYTDKTAQSGIEYIYTVRAYDGKVKGCYNNSGIEAVILETPSELSAVAEQNVGITLTYPQITGAEGYRIYRKNDLGKWVILSEVIGRDIVSYTDTDVEAGKNYTYTVRAKNGSILSGFNPQGVSCLYEVIEETTSPETTTPEIIVPDTTSPQPKTAP